MEEVKNVPNVEENIPETKPEETEKISSSDYKLIVDMIREVDEQYNTLKETLSLMVTNTYGLNPDVLDMILPYEKEQISSLTDDDIKAFLNQYLIIDTDTRYSDMSHEELVESMTHIKDASLVLLSTKKEADEIKESSSDVLKEYFSYMTSDKVRKSREKRLESMKKALELETDEVKINKIKKMINTIESSLNFSFIKERFDELGNKELENIKDGYFTMNRGSYIIERYTKRIVKFGYNPDIYKYFFNIEENFLPKKYSPFNNLFLFIYMRQVAYADPYDKNEKMLVQSLTGALANLIYHKFDSLESEQFFIQVITEILDLFANNEEFDYLEYFKENNMTYEEHPARKQADAAHETKRKESLIRMLTSMKINSFDDSMTADELQEIYNRETELMIKNQVGVSTDEELTIEDSDDVDTENEVVNIEPNIAKIQTDSVYGEFGNTENETEPVETENNED